MVCLCEPGSSWIEVWASPAPADLQSRLCITQSLHRSQTKFCAAGLAYSVYWHQLIIWWIIIHPINSAWMRMKRAIIREVFTLKIAQTWSMSHLHDDHRQKTSPPKLKRWADWRHSIRASEFRWYQPVESFSKKLFGFQSVDYLKGPSDDKRALKMDANFTGPTKVTKNPTDHKQRSYWIKILDTSKLLAKYKEMLAEQGAWLAMLT